MNFYHPIFAYIEKDLRFNTQYALLSLIEKWKKELDNKGYTGAILMDLSKAFEKIIMNF